MCVCVCVCETGALLGRWQISPEVLVRGFQIKRAVKPFVAGDTIVFGHKLSFPYHAVIIYF